MSDVKPQRDAVQDDGVLRSAYRWNTAAGILFALQSTIMLIALTRVCDVYVAGVFTIAFANANLFMQISNYGMRKFQASDRIGEFSFRSYRASRVATCVAMMAASILYVAYSSVTLGYAQDKTLVMVVMCAFKAIDSFEDVFTGGYQVQDRLDIGARMVTARLIAVSAVFMIAVVITRDLLVSITATTVTSGGVLAVQIAYVRKKYQLPDRTRSWTRADVARLLKVCLPLCIADFLLFYVWNASRYAIDFLMDDAAQAYYGYIAMPVFVVNLLASFVYTPMITSLTDQWLAGEVRAFSGRFFKLAALIAAITIACVAGAWLIGVPVLNVLYNAELAPYLVELLVLVAGGGFLALTTLLTVGITIIRIQRILVPLYAGLAVFAFVVSYVAVGQWGLTGAAWAYFFAMATSSAVFAIAFAFGVKRNSKESS